jgi:hypothetical protein
MSNRAMDRETWLYDGAYWLGLGAAGWVLFRNVELSYIGLINGEEWPPASAFPAAAAIAVAEFLACLLLTSPEWIGDIFESLVALGDPSQHKTKVWPVIRWLQAALAITALLAFVVLIYGFDFVSTHWGNYGHLNLTLVSSLFTLFFNVGSEVLAFGAGQAKRLGQAAKLRAANERITLGSSLKYSETLAEELDGLAEGQARSEASQVWDRFYRSNPHINRP